MKIRHLAAVTTLMLSPFGRIAYADTIDLLSQSGDTYVYGLTFTNSETYFVQNDTITISGLSGISSVTPSQFASYLGYTSSSNDAVTLSMAGNGSYAAGQTYTLYTIVADGDSAPDFGQYSMVEADLTESGPVDVTPEPSSLLLLATGVLLLGYSPTAALLKNRKTTLRLPSGECRNAAPIVAAGLGVAIVPSGLATIQPYSNEIRMLRSSKRECLFRSGQVVIISRAQKRVLLGRKTTVERFLNTLWQVKHKAI